MDLIGKDFEFIISGDIDVFSNWDDIMTPNSIEWEKIIKNNWIYYKVGDDEFSYSVEPPGIQMTFNDLIPYSKAKIIINEVLNNIENTGQQAEVIEIKRNEVYRF